jgi:predicted component of type VI protein secretion system
MLAGREFLFDDSRESAVVLGRGSDCDVIVTDGKASRRHAVIEKRRDKFMLADQSANGTFVKPAAELEVCLRREELMLRGHGRMSLGRTTTDPNVTVIEFFCE